MPEMVEVTIDSIRVSLMSPQRVVLLRQRNTDLYLPIWVGAYEAEAISIALQEVETARPLTQDLLKNAITLLGASVVRVEIVSLKDDVFYGNLVIERDGQILDMDARSSDAIALATRTHAPILVARAVMESAGIAPEKDLQDAPQAAPPAPAEEVPPPAPVDKKRLDVFDDFLKTLGKGTGPEDPEGKP